MMAGQVGVIEPDFGIVDRGGRLGHMPHGDGGHSGRSGPRTMFSMFSSDPPSQYCIVRNQRAGPGPCRGSSAGSSGGGAASSSGFRRDRPLPADLRLSFFSSAIAPEAGRVMSRSPILVSLTICASAMMPTIASQAARRAASAGRIAAMCSSRNRMLTIRYRLARCRPSQRASVPRRLPPIRRRRGR